MIRQLSAPTFMTLSISDWSSRLAGAYADILHSSLIHKRLPNQEPYPKVDLNFFFFSFASPFGQYRIILSADTASEVRQLLSQKRR